MKKVFCCKTAFALILAVLIGFTSTSAEPWKFGIISDTQWTPGPDPANKNPNTVPASIIKQVDQQFIKAGVKLVIAVGDMVDTGSQINDYARALYAQGLYNARIGFYPLRGNHEAANGTYTGSDADFWHAYPQISSGLNNATPADITSTLIPGAVLAANPPAAATGKTFTIGGLFSYPAAANTASHSVSYAFQYKDATFMLLDQFQSPDYYTSHIIPEQQDWISNTLSGRPAHTHAFAFTHKNILGGNHKDNMFGKNYTNDPGDGYGVNVSGLSPVDQAGLAAKQAAENTFLGFLQANNVKYMISGHDHHHYNSVVTSPDQHSKVHQLIAQSDSSKFYTPGLPVSGNDVAVEQDLARIGYYIFTVDGPRVTIDYYADNHGGWQSDANYPNGSIDLVHFPLRVTPALTFVKRSTTGYSLNGKEKTVAQGESYAMTDDTIVAAHMERGFTGTSMAILSGANGSTAATNYGKATEMAVNTGWTPQNNETRTMRDDPKSDILTLWGMADLGTEQTDTFVLSMSYDHHRLLPVQLGRGLLGLATRDKNGDWINAVDWNFGDSSTNIKKFVLGPYKSSYGLGTYGIDLKEHTAWAVVNYNGDFAVAGFRHCDNSQLGRTD